MVRPIGGPTAGLALAKQVIPPWSKRQHSVQAAATDKWLTKAGKFRSIGGQGQSGVLSQFVKFPPLAQAYDAVFYLRETSAAQPYGPPAP